MMISKMKDKWHETVCIMKNITQSPVESLGRLIPLGIFLISVVSVIVGYILFIVRGGYTQQISYMKELGISGIMQGFTSGTSGILVSGNVPKIVGILSLLQYVIILIVFFKSVEKTKRVLMIIDLVMSGLMIALPIVCYKEIIPIFTGVTFDTLLGVCIILEIILFAVFAFLTIQSKSGEMFKELVLCLIVHFILMPLLMLLVENIIPLITGIVVLVIFGLIMLATLSAITTGGDSEPVASSRSIKENLPKKESEKTDEKRIEITDYGRAGGINLYKKRGTLSDYIELDNHIVTKSLCSIAEMKSGKCHLYDKASGREIRLEDIPWKN